MNAQPISPAASQRALSTATHSGNSRGFFSRMSESRFAFFLTRLFSRNRASSILFDLVRIPSETFHEQEIANFLIARFAKLNVKAWKDEHGNLIVLIPGKSEETLFLNAHIDTVPRSARQTAMAEPEVREGKLFARGASDCLAGVAQFLYCLNKILKKGTQPEKSVLLVLDVGEEATKQEDKGFAKFWRDFQNGKHEALRGLDIVAAISGEPTAGESNALNVGVSSAGRVVTEVFYSHRPSDVNLPVYYQFIFEGRQSHAAQPDKGRNVIAAMAAFARQFRDEDVLLAFAGTPSGGRSFDPSVTNITPSAGLLEVRSDTDLTAIRLPQGAVSCKRCYHGYFYPSSALMLAHAAKVMQLNETLAPRIVCGVQAKPSCAPTYLNTQEGRLVVDARLVGEMAPSELTGPITEIAGREIASTPSPAGFTRDESLARLFESLGGRRVHLPYSHMLRLTTLENYVVIAGGRTDQCHLEDEFAAFRQVDACAKTVWKAVKKTIYS